MRVRGTRDARVESTGDTVCESKARQKTKDVGAELNWNKGRKSRAKQKQ